MPKKESERIEAGEFVVKSMPEDGAEIRISDEKNQSNGVIRKKSLAKQLEIGAKYSMHLVKIEDAISDDKDTA